MAPPSVLVCFDCKDFARRAGIGYADVADFLELSRNAMSTRSIDDLVFRQTREEAEAEAEAVALMTLRFDDAPGLVPDPGPDHPALAAETVRPARPDGPPDPGANEIRLFQSPPHCGQWFALAGTPRHPRSIQYGGCRTAAEALLGIARNLEARGYRFDGGYEVKAATDAIPQP